MKILAQGRERVWYLVKEWKTKAGLNARTCKCEWSKEVRRIAPSLGTEFYTGYVQKSPEDKNKYYDGVDVNVHGGVTFENVIEGCGKEEWVGFDFAHAYDENIPNQRELVEEECEKLAEQMKEHIA